MTRRVYRLETFELPAPSMEHWVGDKEVEAPEGYVLHSWHALPKAEADGPIVGFAAVLWEKSS